MRSLDVLSPYVDDNSADVREVDNTLMIEEFKAALSEIVDKQNDANSDIVKRLEDVIKATTTKEPEPEPKPDENE